VINSEKSISPRHTIIVAVHIFLLDADKVLLARRFQTGYEDGNFSVPAGHVDVGEVVHEAMVREAREEVGIIIEPEDLIFSHVMHRTAHRDSIDFFFTCTKWKNTLTICEEDKCDRIEWFPINALPENTIPYVREALMSSLAKTPYSSFGW
jgi:mutator protein MutT